LTDDNFYDSNILCRLKSEMQYGAVFAFRSTKLTAAVKIMALFKTGILDSNTRLLNKKSLIP